MKHLSKVPSMVHTNGHLLCAVDVETTGSDISVHEIFQIAILPLDFKLEPVKGILPFYLNIRPENLEDIDPKALKITKSRLVDLVNHSMDSYSAMELLDEWYHRLDLACTPNMTKKIMPLWAGGSFDKKFLMKWLGEELYNTYFYFHERDTQATALAINDRYYHHVERIPFPKVGLGYIAQCFDIDTSEAHDALQDCIITAQVYKKLISMWVPTLPGEYRLSTDDMKSQDWVHPDESMCL